ncbi:MAG: hypothetical protein WCY12_04495 [Candidatus Omnitrophota bacterium]|jgi:hypothetical protein
MNIKLNFYPVAKDIEEQIAAAFAKAIENRADFIEVSYGDASDNIKKRILNTLNKKEYRQVYNRLEKSRKGWGRVYVHFRWHHIRGSLSK